VASARKEYPPFDYSKHLATYIQQNKQQRWTLREWNQRFFDWAQLSDAPAVIKELHWVRNKHGHPYSQSLTELLQFMAADARHGGLIESAEEDAA
jgi:hypothetical protein